MGALNNFLWNKMKLFNINYLFSTKLNDKHFFCYRESEDACVQTMDVQAEEKDVQAKDSKPVGVCIFSFY